jgi:hypothetical protein
MYGYYTGLIALLVCSMNVMNAEAVVIINAVNPSRGSLAGGTRMIIRGSGFSANTGGGNLVYIGQKYMCDPVLLHCTVNQIVCKTRPAMDGYGPMNLAELNGAFGLNVGAAVMQVTVVVDGSEVSTCIPTSGSTCTFQYTASWFHTPRIDSIKPMAVSTGSILTVTGMHTIIHTISTESYYSKRAKEEVRKIDEIRGGKRYAVLCASGMAGI